jgi:hypothetical protein
MLGHEDAASENNNFDSSHHYGKPLQLDWASLKAQQVVRPWCLRFRDPNL